MLVNAISVIGATFMLNFTGRKRLMVFWTAMCAFFIGMLGLSLQNDWGNLALFMTMGFIAAFEFAPGPILWLYMGEIMNDKGLSLGALLNWTCVLLIGFVTPTLMESEVFGVC